MNQIVHNLEAEDFICRVFRLLNGVVNPDNPVLEIRFVDSLDEMPLGCVVLGDPDNVYLLVGSKNVSEFVEVNGMDYSCIYFIDFVIHELYHATQNIDLPRYVSDEEYNDLIERDCEYHTTLFLTNYTDWICHHLGIDIAVDYFPSEVFERCNLEYRTNQLNMMQNNPWIVNM